MNSNFKAFVLTQMGIELESCASVQTLHHLANRTVTLNSGVMHTFCKNSNLLSLSYTILLSKKLNV